MGENNNDQHWHLSKSVPVSLIAVLILQTIGLVIWATRLDGRVQSLESADARHESRLAGVELSRDRLVLIEERQNNVMRQLETNAKKMDMIIEDLGRKK